MHSSGTNTRTKGLLNLCASMPTFGSTTLAAAAIRAGFVILISLLIAQSASAQTYDAVRDWSSQSNPNGVWSYGYLASWGTPFIIDTNEGVGCNAPGSSEWWPFTVCAGALVAHNDTNKEICALTWCFPVHYLAMHPGQNGEISVLRWTAPSPGTYLLQVKFQGQDWAYPTSTYAYVLHNSKGLWLKAPITSYKLPLLFSPRAVRLAAGDTLDFMVDWGKDGNWYGDSTGVQVKVWSLTKP